MTSLRFLVGVVATLCSAPVALAHVPPPPLLPGQENLAERIVSAFATKDQSAYAALLADNVEVFEDGRPVARSKAEWLKRFGPMLSAKGVSFRLEPGYASTGRLLFIEYFNSLASWGDTPLPHCCWSYDAVAYEVVDSRIRTIRRLKGGTFRLDEAGRIAGK